MRRPLQLAIAVVLIAFAAPASGLAAGWDATPLEVDANAGQAPSTTKLALSDDGAIWVASVEDPRQTGTKELVVRRVDARGHVGARRVLGTSQASYPSIALAPVAGGDVRVAYSAGGGFGGTTISVRRLTATTTGDPATIYDAATTEDGDGTANNGGVETDTLRLLAGPNDATWVLYGRANASVNPVVEARRIASDETIGALARPSGAANSPYESAGAVDSQGRLVVVFAGAEPGVVIAVRVATEGTVSSETGVRGPTLSSAINTPAIGIDANGVATIGWRFDGFSPSARRVEVRRVDTTTSPMATLGTGVRQMDDGTPMGFIQYGPLVAVNQDGTALLAWNETDSVGDNDDTIVRPLTAGALADVGVVGARRHLDGPPPEGTIPGAVVPGPGGVTTAFFFGAIGCRAARLDTSGTLLGTDPLPATCGYPVAPADAGNGLAAVWTTSSPARIQLARYVTAAPTCSDGAAVTVTAGATIDLPLPCDGWRPARAIVAASTRGTLGAIDDAAGTVRYTAGATPGADQVQFRSANAAGTSDTRATAVTVLPPPPVPPGPTAPPGPTPPPAPDRTPPAVSGLRVSPNLLRLTRLRNPTATFRLSEAARVTVTLERLVPGHRSGKLCVRTRASRTGTQGCVKAVKIGTLTRSAAAGAARLGVSVRRGKRPLLAGSYRISVVAVDAAGNRSPVARTSFTIRAR